jgi:hypothetical protein
MIRREAKDSQGPCWVLITQIEHAHLAGELAEHWRSAGDLLSHPQVRAALWHHDDGWREWDADPKFDLDRGVPIQFMEMPPAESLAIWRRSIERAEPRGPLVAWLVASHFSALLRGSSDAESSTARAWLDEFDARRAAWLNQWTEGADVAVNPAEFAARALAWLQFFDALSLWFCCADRSEPMRMHTPEGREVDLTPLDAETVALRPWPLTLDGLDLTAMAQWVPQDHDTGQLGIRSDVSPDSAIVLHFRLQP